MYSRYYLCLAKITITSPKEDLGSKYEVFEFSDFGRYNIFAKLTIGVVGCGVGSNEHLLAYSHLPNARIEAVWDIDSKRASQKAQLYGVKRIPPNFDSLLTMDLDLIDIVTPTQTHSELSIRASESGHNVLVEKPMALSSKECKMMIDAARKSGRALCVTHNKRFYTAVRRAKFAVDSIHSTVSRFSMQHFYPILDPRLRPSWILTKSSGGILWESMVHDAYLAEYFLGEIKSVHASANVLKEAVYDSITLILRNAGRIAVCQTEWNAKEPVEIADAVTVQGDHFILNLPHDLLLRRSREYRNRWTTIQRGVYDDLHDPLVKWFGHAKRLILTRSYQLALPFQRTFFVLAQEYLSYLSGITESIPVSAEEGLRSVKVLEAAAKSIESGRPESINWAGSVP